MKNIKINFKPLLILVTILAIFTALFSLMYFTNATAEENAQPNSEEAQTNDTVHVRVYAENGMQFVQEVEKTYTQVSTYENDFPKGQDVYVVINDFSEYTYDEVFIYNDYRSVTAKLHFGKVNGSSYQDTGYRPIFIEQKNIDEDNIDFIISVSPSYTVTFNGNGGKFPDEKDTMDIIEIENQNFIIPDSYNFTPPIDKQLIGWFNENQDQIFDFTKVPASNTWNHNIQAVFSNSGSLPVYNFKSDNEEQSLHVTLTRITYPTPTPHPEPVFETLYDDDANDFTVADEYLTGISADTVEIRYGENGNNLTLSWTTNPGKYEGTKYNCSITPSDENTRFLSCDWNGNTLNPGYIGIPEYNTDCYFSFNTIHYETTMVNVKTQNRSILLCKEVTDTWPHHTIKTDMYYTSELNLEIDTHSYIKYNYGSVDGSINLSDTSDNAALIVPFTVVVTTYNEDFSDIAQQKTYSLISLNNELRDNTIISASLDGENITPFYGYKSFVPTDDEFVLNVLSTVDVYRDVVFDATDGEFKDGSKEVTIQQKVAEKFVMPDPDPIYPEYKLLGYVDENDELYTRDSFVPDPLDSSIATFDTLYASWEFNPTPPEPTPTPEEPEVVNAQTSDSTNAIIALVVLAIIGASITIASRKIYNR